MGLDMYAFAVTHEDWSAFESAHFTVNFSEVPRFGIDIPECKEQIAYWRKFNALHGWMEKLYRKLGGDEEFNCVAMELRLQDLENLSLDINEKRLQPVEGCFFGEQSIDPDDVIDAMKFIELAKSKLPTHRIFYYSWW